MIANGGHEADQIVFVRRRIKHVRRLVLLLSRRGRQPQGEVEPPEAEETEESLPAGSPAPDMAKPPEREDSGDSTSMISRG